LGGKNKGKSWDVERPIILKTHEVRGILDGRQTQLRRIMKLQPSDFKGGIHPNNIGRTRNKPAPYFDAYRSQRYTDKNPGGMSDHWCWWTEDDRQGPDWIKCPYGKPGDRLWVRETWATDVAERAPVDADGHPQCFEVAIYQADGDEGFYKWSPSTHMPRWASRILLEIVNVRVERLQDISYDDAVEQGYVQKWTCISPAAGSYAHDNEPDDDFRGQWIRDNGKESWDANPWVWVVEFKRVTADE
jgi:hypothetical protein